MTGAGERAAALTRQLLAFSRKQVVAPQVLILNALVLDLDRLLRRVIGEDIALAVVTDPCLWPVRADPGQIEQVVMNLVVNARDAIQARSASEGNTQPRSPTQSGYWGKLTITTRNVELEEGYPSTHPEAQAGPHVLLEVSDNGCGMDEATLARVWEPFFTTKGQLGTGLGLATVYGVVKQAGGHVTAQSKPGRGSTFQVYLPRCQGSPTGKSARGVSLMPRGTETVLLVEDEEAVRSLGRHILAGCGYTVLEARDGAEALQVFQQHPGPIDLVVTDVVMPRLGGRELARRLACLSPGVKVLFLSGYTDDAVGRDGIPEAGVGFLHKPFSPAALAGKVREVLDGGSAPRPG
jgi:CheY-like chemotaxis protein